MKAIDLPDAAHVVHARARTHQRSCHRRTLQDTVSRGVLARIATVRHARTILGRRMPKLHSPHVATRPPSTPQASHGESDARIVLLAKNWPPALLNTFRVRARETTLRAHAGAPAGAPAPAELTHRGLQLAQSQKLASPYVFATGPGPNCWYRIGVSKSVLNSKQMNATKIRYFN